MTHEIVPGSIADICQQENVSLEESFLTCDCVILFDVSGSMFCKDKSGKSRYDRGVEELKSLQASMPGKIALIQFAGTPEFVPGGMPYSMGSGNTNLTQALKYIRIADVPDMSFILISDGEPDNERSALEEAKKFQNRIDTVYIGDADDGGSKFMKRLAKASGGSAIDSAAEHISAEVKTLLLGTGQR